MFTVLHIDGNGPTSCIVNKNFFRCQDILLNLIEAELGLYGRYEVAEMIRYNPDLDYYESDGHSWYILPAQTDVGCGVSPRGVRNCTCS